MTFLTGKELSEEIYDTIFYTEKYILVLSPFIQLDEYFKNEVFKTHLNNSQVHIIIGFGKNEKNVSRSFKLQDIEFFTQFPNITIVYIPNLHAKYYGNEKKAIITSMNLIDYSFKNNIEFGVSSEKKLINTNKFFENSQNKCFNIVEDEGFTVFVKRPKYKKKFLGIGKDYVGSEIELNLIQNISNGEDIKRIKLSEFRNEKYVNIALKDIRVDRESIAEYTYLDTKKPDPNKKGHCIRCQRQIPLDLDKPLCWSCYNIWAKFEDPNYPENYCISCGDLKDVNFSKPACYVCYKEIV